VPNASRVVDAAGNFHLFVVHSDGSLTRTEKGGTTVMFPRGVNWAQTYLDPSGRFGLNVLFQSGLQSRWVVYDAAGGHERGTENSASLVSVSTAFDPAGQEVLDVVRNNLDNLPTWFQYDQAGGHQKGSVLSGPGSDGADQMASTVIDRTGARTTDFVESASTFFAGMSGHVPPTWFEVRPSGERLNNGAPVSSVMPSFDATGAVVYDIVHNGEWDYYDAQGGHFMGTGVL
jgi:hypothetical protein